MTMFEFVTHTMDLFVILIIGIAVTVQLYALTRFNPGEFRRMVQWVFSAYISAGLYKLFQVFLAPNVFQLPAELIDLFSNMMFFVSAVFALVSSYVLYQFSLRYGFEK